MPGSIPEPLRALNILESVRDAVAAIDRDWKFSYANQAAARMARCAREQLIGADYFDLFPEVRGTDIEANLRLTMSDGAHRRFEAFYEPFDLWVEMDVHGTPSGLAIFVRDISDRRKAEAGRDELNSSLQLSEQRFRVALRGSPVVVFNQDTNLRYTWIHNPLRKFDDVDWVGKTDFEGGETAAGVIALKQEVLRTGQGATREFVVDAAEGLAHINVHVEALRDEQGAIVGITGSATDVTELRRSQEQIERQRAQLRAVIDGMPGLVSFVDRSLTYRLVSAGYEQWLGRSVSEIEGITIRELLGEAGMRDLTPYLERAFRGEPVSFERRLACSDGIVREVRASYNPQLGSDGTVDGVIALVVDITEQKRLEAARLESESQFRRIVELSTQGIWMSDPHARTTFANPRLAEMLGFTAEELIGRLPWEFIHPDDHERARASFERRKLGDASPMDYRFRRSDGRTIWLDFTAGPIRDAAGNVTAVLALCTDITERKLAQEQLQQAQKLESLGVLAGGIAHDFNNLLVGILGNASLASDILGKASPVQPMLADLASAAERAAKLTRQLLAYAGRDRRTIEPVQLDALVSDILPLLHASIPRHIHLRLQLAGNTPCVEGDEGQLQQIVMNLVINAAEAIPQGGPGVLTVTTEEREPSDDERKRAVIPLAGKTGRFVVLTVSDTGCGMDPDTQARIFDPFFTTKFTGRGLGLSAVLGIIKAHSGTLVLETAPGAGSTFRVFLRASSAPATPARVAERAPSRSTGTILVVDDEPSVRAVAIRTLEYSGYEVIAASDGLEAVAAVKANPGIDAVILDFTMPNMNGDQAAPEIRAASPGIRIVLSSGYSENEARERFARGGFDGFLQKPYTARALVKSVRAAMTAR